ncbi:helix-turn-helix transcriptional regulator [Mesobacillus subterraneus]|uniref:helix-turn-helix domain-containing protein n=1 Tax=Mesobacillus TaxID=2675231 RepID=UPI0020419A0E|nr:MULTISPECIES: helix-turn-helix transcriptional regulator [Mesobacillus]MCM3125836.1 helix-turn-helix transcriptional regulator [Mesobacillus sp. MER 33]MCM3235857.1 helix-turn-helix transcriptional regulator [Mesobacillus sp. MER 48]MCM3667159.1 helix-turn-helix transcriptional regulator [Mesobacillus subterraneus]MCM3685974.1 helix-turn-helix transcriptional regulator [Mesobacillus subterraneus]
MNYLGDFLKDLRGNLSLREVQEGTGISHTYLSTLEKGYDPRTKKQRKPNPEVLQKLARFYKVSYSDLMFLAGYLENEDKPSDESFQEKAEKIKEYSFTLKELDEQRAQLKSLKNIKSSSPISNKDHIDLHLLIESDIDLFYKDRVLSIQDKEKIKTLLKTFFE